MGQDNTDDAIRSTGGTAVGRTPTSEALARLAESIAATTEHSAKVHDRMSARMPEAAEHAARERRLAAAERAAAEAYRQGRAPSADVRQQIVEGRGTRDQRQPDNHGDR